MRGSSVRLSMQNRKGKQLYLPNECLCKATARQDIGEIADPNLRMEHR